MEFDFTFPDGQPGHVLFFTNGFDSKVQVATGRGSRTKVDNFDIARQIPPRVFSDLERERLCRIAIGQRIKLGGAAILDFYVDEAAEPWDGQLRGL